MSWSEEIPCMSTTLQLPSLEEERELCLFLFFCFVFNSLEPELKQGSPLAKAKWEAGTPDTAQEGFAGNSQRKKSSL